MHMRVFYLLIMRIYATMYSAFFHSACGLGKTLVKEVIILMHTQVLIIGGGFAGAVVSQSLTKQGVKSILVDRKDYFEVTFSTLRNAANPQATGNRARKKYRDFIKGAFVQANVECLAKDKAQLSDDRMISFEKVVIASGSRYPGLALAKSSEATSIEERNQELLAINQQLKSAANVMVIGGGVVGVELAGELAAALPAVSITLAHNKAALLQGFKAKAQRKVFSQLVDLGVHIELNSEYKLEQGIYIDQRSGDKAKADVVLVATGTQPNNDFLQPLMSHILNEQGFVKVNQHLAVIGQANFYALGDIADVGEAKLGYLAQEQGHYLAKAIYHSLNNQKLKVYKRKPLMALIPTGTKTGVVQLPFAVTSCKALVNMKQKDLFIAKTYKGLGTTQNPQ